MTEPTDAPEATSDAAQDAAEPPPAPPWGSDEEFNPEKAWKLVQDLRADKEKLAKREVLTPEQKQQLTEYGRLVAASQTEAERQAAELSRWQTEAEQWRTTAQSARIQALAAEFADPDDAVAALAGRNYLDAGGQLDDAQIKADLAETLARKPHWRKTPAGPPPARVPAPNPSQGSGAGSPSADPRQEFAAILQAGINRL